MAEALLRAHAVSRRFGGLVAVDGVSLELPRGQLHAVIGTNGAGKSTLINVLAGELAASSGRVELRGQDVTGWSQPRRALAHSPSATPKPRPMLTATTPTTMLFWLPTRI